MNVKTGWQTIITNSTTNLPEKVKCLRISTDSKNIFVGTENSLIVVDSSSGKEIKRHNSVHKGAIIHITASSFNNWFATIGQDNKVIVWEANEVQPYKRFTLGSKVLPYNMFFNRNETTLYILTSKEIISFVLKGETTEKEIKRVSVGEKDTNNGCLLEKIGILILSDISNNLIAFDLDKFERVNLCQKLYSANVMRFFENDDSFWVAYSNNMIGVYPLTENGLINFNSLEKKAPFEVLAIERVSQDLVAVAGFHSQVCLFSSTGHLVTSLVSIANSVLLRHISIQKDTNQLIIGIDTRLECYDLTAIHNEVFQENYSIKIKDLCTVEIGRISSNAHFSEHKNAEFKLNGLIRSTHFCKESYFAILFGEKSHTKVQLIDWKLIDKTTEIPEDEETEEKFDVIFNRFADKFNINEENNSNLMIAGTGGQVETKNLFDPDFMNIEKPKGRVLKGELDDKINSQIHRQNVWKPNLMNREKSKIKVLKGEEWLESSKQIYIGGSNLYFVLPSKVIQTDFNLRLLHFWTFETSISHTEFHENSKRKETIFVSTLIGEVFKISADNSFPVKVVDHKVPINFFQVSQTKDKIMIIDQNKNLSIYNLKVTQNAKADWNSTGITQAGFSKSASDLFFTIDEEMVLSIYFQNGSFILKNMIDKKEQVIDFSKNSIIVFNNNLQNMRSIELNFGPIYSQLIKDKKTKVAFELMTSVAASQNDYKKLAISALRSEIYEPYVLQAFQLTGNCQLLQMAQEHFQLINTQLDMKKSESQNLIGRSGDNTGSSNGFGCQSNKDFEVLIQANSAKENQFRFQADMLAAEGKFQQAVDYLLKEKQPALAIEMLTILGKYEQAVKILRNPLYNSISSLSKFDLTKIVKLQGEEALRKNDYNKAIEFFTTIKDFKKVVELLIVKEKSQDLINLVRDHTLEILGKETVLNAFEFFKEKSHLPYAKECLIKAQEEKLMIDLLIDFDNYEEAITLAEKISKTDQKVNYLEKVYLPYANLLLAENRFEEAFEIYLKTKNVQFCEKLLKKMIFINVQFKNYKLVSKLYYYTWKISSMNKSGEIESKKENCDIIEHKNPIFLKTLFYSILDSLDHHSSKMIYSKYNSTYNIEPSNLSHSLNCFILLLNLIKVDSSLKYPGDVSKTLEKCIDIAWELKKIKCLKFLLEKAKEFDLEDHLTSKYNFLCQILPEEKLLNATDYFFNCPNCETKGFETNGIKCPECGLELFFCQMTGKQLNVIKVVFSDHLKANKESSLDNFKNFSTFSGQTNRSKWSQSEEDEFLSFVRENQVKDTKKSGVLVSNLKTQGLMSLRKTINLGTDTYLYWGRNSMNEAIVVCQTCFSMNDGEAFDEFCVERKCFNCMTSQLTSAINC